MAVLAAKAGRQSGYDLPEQAQQLVELSAGDLSADDVEFLSSWPRTIELDIAGLGKVLFRHATPRDENEIFTRRTAPERVLPAFESVAAPIVVWGHTHLPFDRALGGLRILNAGSVGMQFGSPGAFWLLLGPTVELRRTEYDVEKAISRVRATGYPQVDGFAGTLRQPQSEAAILEIYARVELR